MGRDKRKSRAAKDADDKRALRLAGEEGRLVRVSYPARSKRSAGSSTGAGGGRRIYWVVPGEEMRPDGRGPRGGRERYAKAGAIGRLRKRGLLSGIGMQDAKLVLNPEPPDRLRT